MPRVDKQWSGVLFADTVPFHIQRCTHTEPLDVDRVQMHQHDTFELFVNITGDASFLSNDRVYFLARGDVFIARPREPHHCVYHHVMPHEHYALLFDAAACLDVVEFAIDDPSCCCFFPAEEHKEEILTLCESLLQPDLPHCDRHYFFLRLLYLLKHAAREPLDVTQKLPSDVIRMLTFIEDRLDTSFTIAEMAKVLYTSQSNVERQFKKHLHMTPLSYVQKRKLQLAATLLQEGTSVSDAALSVGFTDLSYFIQLFKQHYGVTPRRYKQHDK